MLQSAEGLVAGEVHGVVQAVSKASPSSRCDVPLAAPIAGSANAEKPQTAADDNKQQQEVYSSGLSIKEAAYVLGLSRKEIRKRIESGRLTAIRLKTRAPGKRKTKWRIFLDSFVQPDRCTSNIPDQGGSPLNVSTGGIVEFRAQPQAAEHQAVQIDCSPPTDFSSRSIGQTHTQLQHPAQLLDQSDCGILFDWLIAPSAEPQIQLRAAAQQSDHIDCSAPLDSLTESHFGPHPQHPAQLPDFCDYRQLVEQSSTSPAAPAESPKPEASVNRVHAPEASLCPAEEVSLDISEGDKKSADDTPESAGTGHAQPATACDARPLTGQAGISVQIAEMETVVAQLIRQNDYLESRIAALEDQVKYLTASAHSSTNLRGFMFMLPLVVVLCAVASAYLH